jgi:hypothetical protein
VNAVKRLTQDILNQTIAFWSERTGQEFSHEDAREMVANVSGFFTVLAEWQRRTTEDEGSDRLSIQIATTPRVLCRG